MGLHTDLIEEWEGRIQGKHFSNPAEQNNNRVIPRMRNLYCEEII